MTDRPEKPPQKRKSRIQTRNRETILNAALDVFSAQGFRGATLDQIAEASGLSKANLLYYFPSKEAIHNELLTALLRDWLEPLREMNPDGEPLAEVMGYMRRKLVLSRDFPRESRLFANEILQGAPRVRDALYQELRPLVEERARVIQAWMKKGLLAPCDPVHLIISIWAMTQHYADFDIQVRAVIGPDHDPYEEAEIFLEAMFSRLLTPRA